MLHHRQNYLHLTANIQNYKIIKKALVTNQKNYNWHLILIKNVIGTGYLKHLKTYNWQLICKENDNWHLILKKRLQLVLFQSLAWRDMFYVPHSATQNYYNLKQLLAKHYKLTSFIFFIH